MQSQSLVFTAIIATAFASSLAFADHTVKANEGKLSKDDAKFVEETAQNGIAEVQLAKLASEKAVTAEAKQFAEHMIKDHTKTNDELKAFAQKRGLVLPTAATDQHRKTYEKLASTDKFDRDYISEMVSSHKKTISNFENAAKKADDQELRAWAGHTLPTLRQHLQMAEDAEKAIKK